MSQFTRKGRSSTAEHLVNHGAIVVKMLRDIAEATNTSYLKPIAGISELIFSTVQTVKANKDECMKMTEQTYELLCAIINVYQDTTVQLSPVMVHNIGKFSETLGKIVSFMRQQVDGSLIKRIVRHAGNSSLLADCKEGLKHAQEVFMVETSILLSAALASTQKDADARHREILKAISMQDHPGELSANLTRSSSSLSMIPASPKIFHGREAELIHVNNALLHADPARIAILGVGGIGKSTLALAALHSANIVSKFSTRQYFVSCESASSASMLLNTVGRYFGAKEGESPMKVIRGYIHRHLGPSVLVLDNLETPWEPLDGRAEVEEFLSLLSDIKQLDIIVTMRGAERPGKIKWTRPFLPQLQTLSDEAARRIFFDISDPFDDETRLTELLNFTDKLPLAVTLIASLAAFEGCDSVYNRWKLESTSMLSDGFDKQSNLDKSIMLSFTSPRMVATPGSQELLSILSLLPDGISEGNLERTGVPLANIARCRVTLCRTSLAFVDDRDSGRLKVLVPVRQYIRRNYPPSRTLVQYLQNFMYNLVRPFKTWEWSPVSGIFRPVTENLGNIHSLIEYALDTQDTDITQTIYCVIDLGTYYYLAADKYAPLDLLLSLEKIVESSDDLLLQGRHALAIMRWLDSSMTHTADATDSWAQKAIKCFIDKGYIAGQAETYHWLAHYHGNCLGNFPKGIETARVAVQLSIQAGDPHLQSRSLSLLCNMLRRQGCAHAALSVSYEANLVAQNSGNLLYQVMALLRQSGCHMDIGQDFLKASICIDEALVLSGALDMGTNSLPYLTMLNLRAEIHLLKTEYKDARKFNREILGDFDLATVDVSVQKISSDTFHSALALSNLAEIDIATGDADRCGYNMEIRLNTIRDILKGTARLVSACDTTRGDLCLWRKQYDLAQSIYEQSLSANSSIPVESSSRCYEGLTKLALEKANYVFALRYTILFLLEGRRAQAWIVIHRSLRYLAEVALVDGDTQTAEVLFNVALEGFTFSDIHRDRAECMLHLGKIWIEKNPMKAYELWKAARLLFEKSSQRDGVAECDTLLVVLELGSLEPNPSRTAEIDLNEVDVENIQDEQGSLQKSSELGRSDSEVKPNLQGELLRVAEGAPGARAADGGKIATVV